VPSASRSAWLRREIGGRQPGKARQRVAILDCKT
jgi:hypothetical protein